MTEKKDAKAPTSKGAVELTEEALEQAAGGAQGKITTEHKWDQKLATPDIKLGSQVFKF